MKLKLFLLCLLLVCSIAQAVEPIDGCPYTVPEGEQWLFLTAYYLHDVDGAQWISTDIHHIITNPSGGVADASQSEGHPIGFSWHLLNFITFNYELQHYCMYHPVFIFSDNFEEGNLNKWSKVVGSTQPHEHIPNSAEVQ